MWMTGLSGAGKSTIAQGLRARLQGEQVASVVLDGDEVRAGLSQGLGFSQADRSENIRRMAEVARLLSRQGMVVIVAAITPLQAQRTMAREIVGEAYREIHVHAPFALCEQGLYARARRNEIAAFTGISDSYEPPVAPDLVIDTSACRLADAVESLMLAFGTAPRAAGAPIGVHA
jgi:adenylylsulfate kinase